MKLYLSSYRVPTLEEFYELMEKREGISAALITNAKDYRDFERKEGKIESLSEYLGSIGVASTTVDLRDYSRSENVYEALKNYDLIYAIGGNTFNLRQAMKTSGFDMAIRDLLGRGAVYAGESAGAIVMGTSLKGFETMDSLEEVRGEVAWEGIGLVDKVMIPHADSPDYRDRVLPLSHQYKDPIVLNDNQAYIIDGNSQRLVTGIHQEY